MIDFLNSIPPIFLMLLIFSGACLVLSAIVELIRPESDIAVALICFTVWPVVLLYVFGLAVGCCFLELKYLFLEMFFSENIKYYEKLNETIYECAEDEIVLHNLSFDDISKINAIIKQQNLYVEIDPITTYKIMNKKSRIVPPYIQHCSSYKLTFDELGDKAIFQLYWANKDEI